MQQIAAIFGSGHSLTAEPATRPYRTARILACFLIACVTVLAAATASFADQRPDRIHPPTVTGPSNVRGPNSVTDMWRDIRKGQPGLVTLPGQEGAVLIQSEGHAWQARRSSAMIDYGAKLLAIVAAAIALFFLLRGRIKIAGGRTGKVIPRFSLIQRVAHWSMAVLFVLLGVSGLILLWGRTLLKPLIGADAFATLASASMQGHNLFGPLFIPALLALLVTFIRGNGYRPVDLKWLLKGGGFFGGHASSHKYNFGEKTWFWWSIVFGLVISVSGVVMLFPDMFAGRISLHLANLAHAAAALLFIAFAIGHIYLGTLGMEGALEGMTTGSVDENWAKEHHDLWYEAHKRTATADKTRAAVIAAARGDALSEGAAE